MHLGMSSVEEVWRTVFRQRMGWLGSYTVGVMLVALVAVGGAEMLWRQQNGARTGWARLSAPASRAQRKRNEWIFLLL